MKPVVIACGHLFCLRCASGWFEDQENCPCCRYRIVVKELISENNFLAKECPEVGFLLPGIFTVGNLHASLKNEGFSQDVEHMDIASCSQLDTSSVLNDPASEQFLANVVAPLFREMFHREGGSRASITTMKSQNEVLRNSFSAALWLLKHALSLSPLTGKMEAEDVTFLQCLPGLIRHEALYGSEQSRESLIVRVMSVKLTTTEPNQNLSFIIPFTPCGSRQKLANTLQQQHQPRSFRFRVPSANGFTRLILAICIFIFIAFAVHIFDEKNYPNLAQSSCKVKFNKVDFFVYFVTVFTLISYTETERLIQGRRRQRRPTIRRNVRTWNPGYQHLRGRRRRNFHRSPSPSRLQSLRFFFD